MDAIFKRVSMRTFLDIDVDDVIIERILRAGMTAPSAKNQRPWEFYVIRNKAILTALSTCTPYAGPLRNAPVAIAACYRTNDLAEAKMVELDMSCCCENMLLEAAEMDMGSVWLSFAPLPERQTAGEKVLALPENLKLFAVLPVGYPMAEAKQRDRFDPTRIHEVN